MISGSVSPYVDAMLQQAVQASADAPAVRGADWRRAVVQTVNADGTVVTTDGITARRLETYQAPVAGDIVVLMISGSGNWIAVGRTAASTERAWTSYPVTWTGSTTNPAVGNGTLIGRYRRDGTSVDLQINLTAGSTTNTGVGTLSFTLPFTAANNGCTYIGQAHFLRNTANRFGGQYIISPNAGSAGPAFPASATDCHLVLWATTAAISWLPFTNGDQMRITITYEAAP